jgi:hypothetical protein
MQRGIDSPQQSERLFAFNTSMKAEVSSGSGLKIELAQLYLQRSGEMAWNFEMYLINLQRT